MNRLYDRLSGSGLPCPCLFYPVAGEMNVPLPDLLTDGSLMGEALIRIAGNDAMGAVIRMTELWCEAACFGMTCDLSSGGFPRLGKALYADADSLDRTAVPPAVNAVTEPLIEAVALAAPVIGKPLLAGVTAPYTLASVLRGSEDLMMDCMMDPQRVHGFLSKLTNFLTAYMEQYKKAGAAGIILAEPSVAMISPAMTEEFSNRYIRRIIDALQDEGFSVVYHNCGAVNAHLGAIGKLDAHGFHFGSDVDLAQALDLIPGDRLVMGNIDPGLFLSADGAGMKRAVSAARRQFSDIDRFVLSTGCDLSPHARPSVIEAFLHLANE